MNIIKTGATILSFLLLSAVQVACATNNCTFDKNHFNQARYENKSDIKYAVWEDSTKTAKIITTKGELISVKHWSCDHLGTHAVMLIGPYSEDNFSNLNGYFRKLTAITLDGQEADMVNQFLARQTISLEQGAQTFRLKSDEYSEFYLMLGIVNESVVIEIKYYRG